jgi:hypothetical protein
MNSKSKKKKSKKVTFYENPNYNLLPIQTENLFYTPKIIGHYNQINYNSDGNPIMRKVSSSGKVKRSPYTREKFKKFVDNQYDEIEKKKIKKYIKYKRPIFENYNESQLEEMYNNYMRLKYLFKNSILIDNIKRNYKKQKTNLKMKKYPT